MKDSTREGLKVAADRFARAMRSIAAVRTRRAAAAVNIRWEGEEAVISAGREEGEYGWEPITALMFDNNLRHPLFGNKNHWYKQGRWPITAYTERAAIDDAAEAFADAALPILLKEHGYTDH